MFKVTVTSSRPNLDTQFYPRSNDLNNYMTDLQVAGKCLKEVRLISPDKLTFTYQSFWDSEESYNAYRSNSIVIDYNSVKDTYNLENNITSEIVKEHLP
jgi:hypothetical protein